MLIAQITDLHIKPEGRLAYRRVDTAEYLRNCVRWLGTLRPAPDVVLATGDLVDAALPEEYARLKELLRPIACPLYLLPGNHDRRDALRVAFPEHAYLPRQGFLHYTVEDYPLRLIGLDTLDEGKDSGLMCAERLAWLEARLGEQPRRPTILFMHHPPFATGIERMDQMGLEGASEMAHLVRTHPQVERVLCGHVHRPIQVRWAGTVASVSPSTAYQVVLNLQPDAALSFAMEPPAVQLLYWNPASGLVGHLSYVDAFPGPYPFREGGQRIQ